MMAKSFLTLQKWKAELCLYLAGRPYSSKLPQNVSVFQDMRDRLNKFMTEHVLHLRSIIDEGGAMAAASDPANPYQSLITSDNRETVHTSGKRNHRKNPMSKLLPKYKHIDMTMCGKEWFPLCRMTDHRANVSIEATVDNFKVLFELVNEQLACEAPVARTPARKLRRRKSDSQAPTDSPGSRIYFFKGKGFFQRNSQAEVSTFGSGSSQRYVDKRRYLKVDPPLSGERATAAKAKGKSHKQRGGKCKTISRVLSHDDNDSSNEDPFANDEWAAYTQLST